MSPPPPPPVAARHLASGARAVITRVIGAGSLVERLAALGLVPGAPLRVVSAGSPMAVAVGASRVALGEEWALAVQVQPL
jgi:Fe2+ transport system protein FeoA